MTRFTTEQIQKKIQTLQNMGREGEAQELSELTGVTTVTGAPTESYASGLARSAGQGLFGLGDEMAAGARAGYGSLFGDDELPIGQRYDAALADERAKLARFQKANPIASGVAEFAGAIPASLGTGGLGFVRFAAQKGAPVLQKMLYGGALGGAQGAAYGFGSGEGARDRIQEGIVQAPLGAGIGALMPAAGALVRNVVDARAVRRAAKAANVDPKAYSVVTAATRDVADPVAQLKKAGPTATVADVVDSRVLDELVQSSPSAAQVARRNIGQRVRTDTATLNKAMDRFLGPATDQPRKYARQIAKQTAPQRDKAYRQAYAEPINYANASGKEIQNIFKTVPANILRKATTEANEEMSIDGVGKNQILLKEVGGKVELSKLPNMVEADYLKRGLDLVAEKSKDQFDRLLPQGRRAQILSARLRNSLRANVPLYGEALRQGSDKIQRDRGLKLGMDMFRNKTTFEDVTDFMGDISTGNIPKIAAKDLKTGMRMGLEQALKRTRQTLSDPAQEIGEVKKLIKDLSSRNSREKIKAVLGAKEAEVFFNVMNRAAKSIVMRGSIDRNSATFGRMAQKQMREQFNAPSALELLPRMEFKEGVKRFGQSLTGQTPQRVFEKTDAMNKKLAEFLTGPSGQNAADALQAAMRVPQRQAVTQGREVLFNRLFPTVTPTSALTAEELTPSLFGGRLNQQ